MPENSEISVVEAKQKVLSPIVPEDAFGSFVAGLENAMPAYWCSVRKPAPDVTRDTPEYRAYAGHVLKLLNSENDKIGKRLSQPLSTVNILAHPVSIEQDNGEMIAGLRVVIELANGEVLGCVSTGIAQGLQRVMTMFGPPPWNPPVVLMVESQNTRKGRRVYVVSVFVESLDAAEAAKGN